MGSHGVDVLLLMGWALVLMREARCRLLCRGMYFVVVVRTGSLSVFAQIAEVERCILTSA
jgi:hypothetical protein